MEILEIRPRRTRGLDGPAAVHVLFGHYAYAFSRSPKPSKTEVSKHLNALNPKSFKPRPKPTSLRPEAASHALLSGSRKNRAQDIIKICGNSGRASGTIYL